MLYQISEELINSIKNLTTFAESHHLNRDRPMNGDDVILDQSLKELDILVQAWEHDKQQWESMADNKR